MKNKFDVIVVGAGLAGLITAYCLGKNGFNVVVIERGEFPGSKNVIGGVLYTPMLSKLFPSFSQEAPLERPVAKKKFYLLNRESALSLDFWAKDFEDPPYNHSYTVLRAKFDRWLSEKVKAVGVLVVSQTEVTDIIRENGRVVGVLTGREKGEIFSDVVVIAEGTNSILADKIGLGNGFGPKHFVTAVKEVIEIPSKVIVERFNLSGETGLSINFFCLGHGFMYSGFIYTNKESLSFGVGAYLNTLAEKRVKLPELLEDFKNHPIMKPLLMNGIFRELCGHMIPEGTYHGKVYSDNLIVVGDAAGLLNPSPIFLEGTNLAIASGVFAAETIKIAKSEGDFSASSLSRYLKFLKKSFVLRDVNQYQKVPFFIQNDAERICDLTNNIFRAFKELFEVDERSKKDKLKIIRGKFPMVKTSWDLFRIYRGLL